MINSSIRMIERKIGINILSSVIIGITILLGVICASTYDKLTEKTARYSSFTKMNGGIYYFDYGEYEKFLANSEVLPDVFHGVKESVLAVNNTFFGTGTIVKRGNQGSDGCRCSGRRIFVSRY